MKSKKLISLLSMLIVPSAALAHGNVDISNGSQVEFYKVTEHHVNQDHQDHEDGYGIEAVWMHDSGYFIYGEGETGIHNFYQLGGGKYFQPSDTLGWYLYGAYAQGGYEGSNELRSRLGADYQAFSGMTLHGRLGFDYGNSKITLDDHEHYAAHHDSGRSKVSRMDAGFTYALGEVAEFKYNYVMQKQHESALVLDNKSNLHYEARITYTDSALKPYMEYRQTNKAFDKEHFEEQAVQLGVAFNF